MDVLQLHGVLSHFPMLAALTPDEIRQLASMSTWKTAPKNSYLYLADQPSDCFCLLVSGAVKIGVYSSDGREIIKNIQHPYTLFGELSLSGERQRAEFASSMNQEVHYITVEAAPFRKLMEQNGALGQAMFLYLGERLRKAERQWESLILKDVRTRIVEFLKESAGARGRQVGFETLLKHSLTQQDIANLVGASRQTVTVILNDLRKSNLIYFNRNSILIRDLEKLN